MPVLTRMRSRNASQLAASRTALVATARYARHAVVVHHPAEPFSARTDASTVVAPMRPAVNVSRPEQDAARGLLQHLRTLAGQVLRDDQPHRRRADVDGGHDGGGGHKARGLWP